MNTLRLALFAVPVALVACVYDNEPPRRLTRDPGAEAKPPPPAGSVGGVPAPSAPSSPAPLLVEVDTDQTMTADPGQGVGVFVEYASGGRWSLWWTCDTARTNQSCDFSISAQVASGTITDVDASQLGGGFVASPTPSRVDAKVVTATELHGLAFSTNPGAVLTVEAAVSGIKDGAFLFFVQDGQVNGGYTGKLTNPLQVVGKSP